MQEATDLDTIEFTQVLGKHVSRPWAAWLHSHLFPEQVAG